MLEVSQQRDNDRFGTGKRASLLDPFATDASQPASPTSGSYGGRNKDTPTSGRGTVSYGAGRSRSSVAGGSSASVDKKIAVFRKEVFGRCDELFSALEALAGEVR